MPRRTSSGRTSTTTRTENTPARPAGRNASMAKTSPTTTTTDANIASTSTTNKQSNGEMRDFYSMWGQIPLSQIAPRILQQFKMKQKEGFKDRFSDYLTRRVGESKKKELFGEEFSEKSSSSRTMQLEEDNSHTVLLSPNSNISFNSSEFSSRFKSSNKHSVESSQPKKLRKLRELEENQCAICLSQISSRVHLDCKHKFCYECLQEWLKNSSKCPYCRSEVTRFWFKGEEHLVESKEFQYEPEQEENLDWVCYNCDQTQDGDIVLICDRCEANACHIECDPSLRGREPRGDWYCHFCR